LLGYLIDKVAANDKLAALDKALQTDVTRLNLADFHSILSTIKKPDTVDTAFMEKVKKALTGRGITFTADGWKSITGKIQDVYKNTAAGRWVPTTD
jgi:hypothetical protein